MIILLGMAINAALLCRARERLTTFAPAAPVFASWIAHFEDGSTTQAPEGQRTIARVVIERAMADRAMWGLCDVVFYKRGGASFPLPACRLRSARRAAETDGGVPSPSRAKRWPRRSGRESRRRISATS